MAKGFVETTILTNLLLKPGTLADAAQALLAQFAETELPAYAIKEFKRGPLRHYIWMHNKFATTNSFAQSIMAIHRMSRSPRTYTTSTALEALGAAASENGPRTTPELEATYGPEATQDKIMSDSYRLSLKRLVYSAWGRRREVTTKVVYELSCYDEKAPYEKRGLIELDPTSCRKRETCCLAPVLRALEPDLRKMKEVITQSGSTRREDVRRARALRLLYRKSIPLSDQDCRDLGDAVFAALAPSDATILTTNVRDLEPLAQAIGKTVSAPP